MKVLQVMHCVRSAELLHSTYIWHLFLYSSPFLCQFTLFISPLKYAARVIYGLVLVSEKCSLFKKTSGMTVQNKVACIEGNKYLKKLCSVKCLYLIYFCIKQFMLHKRMLVLSM